MLTSPSPGLQIREFTCVARKNFGSDLATPGCQSLFCHLKVTKIVPPKILPHIVDKPHHSPAQYHTIQKTAVKLQFS